MKEVLRSLFQAAPEPFDMALLDRRMSVLLEAMNVERMLAAKAIAMSIRASCEPRRLEDVEFKCYSQFGDDGIIQYLVHMLGIELRTFVEFGVEDYRESNTRFLLLNDNWRGLVIDGSGENVARIKSDPIFWRQDLTAVAAFIDTGNINRLIDEAGFSGELGILSIDIDGNDYWVWESIETVRPLVVICEYNSVFGPDRAISIPYDPAFFRGDVHHSYLYYGASLPALVKLGKRKGYAFVGSNSAGNNAYFVRSDRLGRISEITAAEGHVSSKFRESRDAEGRFSYLSGSARLEAMRGLPVVDVTTGRVEAL